MSLRPIQDVAADLGLTPSDLVPYGHDKAKLDVDVAAGAPHGHMILVSAITPTPAGEGKTTTTIGLVQGLSKLDVKVCAALREPSLGPCFGIKGGGTGGGNSRIEPSPQINLHFTGDFHAITAAHNLLAAMLDNHLFFGNELDIDPTQIVWPRVLDVNDRALRQSVVGLGGRGQGVPRENSFDITAASEVMAVLCLANDLDDLRARLDRLLVAYTRDRQPVTAGQLGATGAMVALLADAIRPNLVQTTEGVPAIVHGGPFANIAHGCNSVIATRAALRLADVVVTEAGFGFDLGAEKFFDIKCRSAGLAPALVVLVTTVKALKMHGGTALADLGKPDAEAVRAGLPNLSRHLESLAGFGVEAVVAINRFGTDTDEEIAVIREHCAGRARCATSDHFARGGEGALELAREVLDALPAEAPPLKPVYALTDKVPVKIEKIVRQVYGGVGIELTAEARRDLGAIKRLGLLGLPVCMAKTQNSLSDDPKRRGRPEGFTVTVRRVLPNTGAGFLVVLTGDMMRMPGLPRVPAALAVDLVDGKIVGVE